MGGFDLLLRLIRGLDEPGTGRIQKWHMHNHPGVESSGARGGNKEMPEETNSSPSSAQRGLLFVVRALSKGAMGTVILPIVAVIATFKITGVVHDMHILPIGLAPSLLLGIAVSLWAGFLTRSWLLKLR